MGEGGWGDGEAEVEEGRGGGGGEKWTVGIEFGEGGRGCGGGRGSEGEGDRHCWLEFFVRFGVGGDFMREGVWVGGGLCALSLCFSVSFVR